MEILFANGQEYSLLSVLGILDNPIVEHIAVTVHHLDLDFSILNINPHGRLCSYDIFLKLVALTFIVDSIYGTGMMIMSGHKQVYVTLHQQRQDETREMGLPIKLIVSCIISQHGEVAYDDAVLGSEELLRLNELFQPLGHILTVLVESCHSVIFWMGIHLVLTAVYHDNLEVTPSGCAVNLAIRAREIILEVTRHIASRIMITSDHLEGFVLGKQIHTGVDVSCVRVLGF